MKKSAFTTFIPIFFGITFLFSFKESKNFSGIVIILNGPSASGKSSIQKKFQELMMPNLWVKVGIDNLLNNAMPDITSKNISFWQSPNLIHWIEKSKDKTGNNIITFFVGEQGKKVVYAMNSAIAAYAQNGCNVIVDYIAYNQDWFKDLEKKITRL